ncbi:MAG: NADH-quinone oxidoreductase subunit C [Myxococcales bacterium]|nr:NADH-quinone oxidoreductase subunit C [Myxococcales bacterium]MCB9646336.1 NADH-quinone oxidoreductase subunit C [Deltaproteobacteria bacterium]
MSKVALDRLLEKFGDAVIESHANHGDETAIVKAERLHEVMAFLRDDPVTSMELLSDVTAVDLLGIKEPRFEVVYHLYSISKNQRLRIKAPVSEEDPKISTVTDLFKVAVWEEREVYDLYGIRFEGHPDLRRILLYPEFEGHPLRKDYEIEHRQPRIPAREGRHHL